MASTPPMEYLNSMWQYIPQGHEKPLKHAVYNTVANTFILIACVILVGVYFILAPFIRPLYWAVLCGTFLYPFKRSLTNFLRTWLIGLHSSGTPFALGAVVLPFQVAHTFMEIITKIISNNLKVLISILLFMPFLYLLYHYGPLQHLWNIMRVILSFLYDFLGFCGSRWMWSVFASYLVAVVFFWRPDTEPFLRFSTIPIWIAFVLHIANIAGNLRVPLLIFMVVILVAGFLQEADEMEEETAPSNFNLTDSKRSRSLFSKVSSFLGICPSNIDPTASDDEIAAVASEYLFSPPDDGQTGSKDEDTPGTFDSTISDTPKPETLSVDSKNFLKLTDRREKQNVQLQDSPDFSPNQVTNQYFLAVIWGHGVVRLWMHVWLALMLLLLPILHYTVGKLFDQFQTGGMFHEQADNAKRSARLWLDSRRDVIMPQMLRGLGRLALKGDKKIISILEQFLDSATTVLFILMLIVGSFLISVISAAQIQRESMYIITSTQTILNNTVNSDMAQWLPNAEEMRGTMEDVLNKTHQYGRNFIVSKVKEYVDGSLEEQDKVVTQVLEIWDNVYAAILSTETEVKAGPKTDPSVSNLWQMVSQGTGNFQFSNLVQLVKDNFGMLWSILESVWAVVKGNMVLVLTMLTNILSAVLGGGSAILNFVISAIIFLTTLFYLLASSGDVYKPAEIFSNMSPGSTGSRLGQAVEEAISGVFMASLKMAFFYFLYTWLIHLVFGQNIVFIPSALAALFAAVPFVGPYWAGLPAAVELWLVHDQGLRALLLIIAHMIPSYFVDTAIYSEIKGGHPYVTGLSIAGGMYCMGLEGALIGPIILCCLIVGVNMYSNMLRNEPTTPTPGLWRKTLRSVSSDSISTSQSRRISEIVSHHSRLPNYGK